MDTDFWIGLVGLIIILIVVVAFQHLEISRNEIIITEYQSQVATLKAESAALQSRYSAAATVAQAQVATIAKSEDEIVNDKIGKSCNDAIAWGVSQTNRMD